MALKNAFTLAVFGLLLFSNIAVQGLEYNAGEIARVLPDPADVVMTVGEEEFEDYLDYYLSVMEPIWANTSSIQNEKNTFSGCNLAVNGDLGQPQPVFIRGNTYLTPSSAGIITLQSWESIRVSCPGRLIVHPILSLSVTSATATCVSGTLVSGSGWLNGNGQFVGLTCSGHAYHDARYTGARCYDNKEIIEVGFDVDGTFYPKYETCFDRNRMEVLYAKYEQNPEHAVHQTGVDRPSFLAGTFFGTIGVNNRYTQVVQKQTIASIVGDALADKYVTTTQFLARGHLAAKSDFVFATGQRASFWFINAAPQWQPFNGGNWNTLEQQFRLRIGVAGYQATVYTGTWGVTQLRDANNVLRDIYLYTDANNNPQLPVPLYYYKVAHDRVTGRGIAFVGLNNPYYTLQEIQSNLVFCRDICRNNSAFSWLTWNADNIANGYSFCCEVDDFRRTVPHLPAFTTTGILS